MPIQQFFAPLYTRSNPTATVAVTGGLRASVTVAATAGGANASALLPGNAGYNNNSQMQIANVSTSGTSWAYVNFGQLGSVPAATVASSLPIPPNTRVVVQVDPEVDGASVILGTAASTANVVFTRGNG